MQGLLKSKILSALDLVRSISMVSDCFPSVNKRETIKRFALARLLLFLRGKNKRSTRLSPKERAIMVFRRKTIKGFALDQAHRACMLLKSCKDFNKPKGAFLHACAKHKIVSYAQLKRRILLYQPFVSLRETIRNRAALLFSYAQLRYSYY